MTNETDVALEALDQLVPPHLRTSRHGENFMGARYELIRAALSARPAPECKDCGDSITAHDPGICGNCYAMKRPLPQATLSEEPSDYYILALASEHGDAHDESFIFNRDGRWSVLSFARAVLAAARQVPAGDVRQDRDVHSHMMVVATRASHAAGDVSHKAMLRAICKAIIADKNLMRKLAAASPSPVGQEEPGHKCGEGVGIVGVPPTVPVDRPATTQEAQHALEIGACLPNGVLLDAFGRERVRYVRITLDGSHLILHPSELEAWKAGEENPGQFTYTDVYLSEEEADALPEFDGF